METGRVVELAAEEPNQRALGMLMEPVECPDQQTAEAGQPGIGRGSGQVGGRVPAGFRHMSLTRSLVSRAPVERGMNIRIRAWRDRPETPGSGR